MKDVNLSIVPVGHIERDLLLYLKGHLEHIGFRITIADELPVPERACNIQRNQYLIYPLIDLAKDFKGYNLLITPVDLYTPGLNYVFGFGPGPNAIISIARLKGDHVRERMIKEAVHELGHVFSLSHCPDPHCVMHFSNTIENTDHKSKEFCPECQNFWPLKHR